MLHVAYCFDENYQQHFGASVFSLLQNFGKDLPKLCVHVVTDVVDEAFTRRIDELRDKFKVRIELYAVDEARLAQLGALPLSEYARHLARSAYFRLMLPDILPPEVERILYLDSDTIVLGSPAGLMQANLGSASVIGVRDLQEGSLKGSFGYKNYINTGVLILNLKNWRRMGYTAKCIEYAAANPDRVLYADQCCINSVLADDMLFLKSQWNRFIRMESRAVPATPPLTATEEAQIVHFIGGNKPWQSWYLDPAGILYWRYLEQSPWAGAAPEEPVKVDDHRYLARKLALEGNYVEAVQRYEDVIAYLLNKSSERGAAETAQAAAG